MALAGAGAKNISRGLGPIGAGPKISGWGHGSIGAAPGPQKTLGKIIDVFQRTSPHVNFIPLVFELKNPVSFSYHILRVAFEYSTCF